MTLLAVPSQVSHHDVSMHTLLLILFDLFVCTSAFYCSCPIACVLFIASRKVRCLLDTTEQFPTALHVQAPSAMQQTHMPEALT